MTVRSNWRVRISSWNVYHKIKKRDIYFVLASSLSFFDSRTLLHLFFLWLHRRLLALTLRRCSGVSVHPRCRFGSLFLSISFPLCVSLYWFQLNLIPWSLFWGFDSIGTQGKGSLVVHVFYWFLLLSGHISHHSEIKPYKCCFWITWIRGECWLFVFLDQRSNLWCINLT